MTDISAGLSVSRPLVARLRCLKLETMMPGSSSLTHTPGPSQVCIVPDSHVHTLPLGSQVHLHYTHTLARFAHLVDMHTNVISHEGGGKLMEMVVPSRGIWGTAGIGGLNIDMAVGSELVGSDGVV